MSTLLNRYGSSQKLSNVWKRSPCPGEVADRKRDEDGLYFVHVCPECGAEEDVFLISHRNTSEPRGSSTPDDGNRGRTEPTR